MHARSRRRLGLKQLYLKDETENRTGTRRTEWRPLPFPSCMKAEYGISARLRPATARPATRRRSDISPMTMELFTAEISGASTTRRPRRSAIM